MLEVSNQLMAPEASRLEANTNTETLISYLTKVVGIEENEHIPPELSTRLPLQATVAHALFFNFQRQDEIANREFLFHRQTGEAGEFITQAIRDVIPYFLGAVDPDHVRLRGELRSLERELKRAQQRLTRIWADREREREEALALASEAQEVGLLGVVGKEADAKALQALLEEAVDSPAGLESLTTAQGTAFTDLERRRAQLSNEYRVSRDEIQLVNTLLREQTDFSSEVTEHVSRLQSLNLLPDVSAAGPDVCPVCQQDVKDHLPHVSDLTASLESLSRELRGAERDRPRLQRVLATLEERADTQREEIAELQNALESLAAREAEVAALRERVNAQSYVRGRINHYLQHLVASNDDAVETTQREINRLQRRAAEAEQRLNPALVNENVVSILNTVGRDMGTWAQRLQLEYATSPLRIDVSRLNVVADTVTGTVPLDRMGSAANWVGYHLVAYLALHKLFVEKNRPVPRFVVFDQPTQAFYPPEASGRESIETLDDADRRAVTRMFELFRDVAAELGPELQIIVTDHANLNPQWFQEAIVEEWRGGTKLVPRDWPT
jgi:hypothetical protein